MLQDTSAFAQAGSSWEEFAKEELKQHPDINGSILHIIYMIALAGKIISQRIHAEKLRGMLDSKNTLNALNPSGDEQQKLDLIAHQCFIDFLKTIDQICAIISEEEESFISLNSKVGKYIVALDPLDGSSNIRVDAPVGTIFSIYQRVTSLGEAVQPIDILQPGSKQMAAGYMLYSTSTLLVYGTRYGVHKFTYDPNTDNFLLTHRGMSMPTNGKTYAVNDGYLDNFPRYIQHYIQACRSQGLSARYSGTLAADFHRHLLQGGIYLYPSTASMPTGKLRLMFECNALAFLAEQAGGLASDGKQSILHIEPKAIHQRSPLYIGTANMVHSLQTRTPTKV